MLPKNRRGGAKLFRMVQALNKRPAVFNSEYFTLKVFCLPEESEVTKFAFIISKKVAKSAVKRNLVKRRMRHAIHQFLKENHVPDGLFFVFYLKNDALGVGYQSLKNKMISLMKKYIEGKWR